MVKTSAAASIKNHLRAIAEKNRNIVLYFYNQYKKGKLSEASARALATEIMLSQKIGKTGYIYCLDKNGIVKIHPKKN